MTVQHPITQAIPTPTPSVLERLFNAIETDDEAHFLRHSENGTLEAALPEWGRMKGSFNTQHRTHDFTLDVHTAKVVVKTRQSHYFQMLSPHWKRLVTIAALLHDIAKDAGAASERLHISPDPLHPLKGAAIARRTLPAWGFSPVDTFCIAMLIRYHQLFGRMIIQHNTLGHPPTEETLLQHACIFPDELFLNALLPLTEGDIRAVKANDAIFNADVERKLADYSSGVRHCIQALQANPAFNTLPRHVDDATQIALCYGHVDDFLIQQYGGSCPCGLEGIDSEVRFAFTPTQPPTANAFALLAFLEEANTATAINTSATQWMARNPFPYFK